MSILTDITRLEVIDHTKDALYAGSHHGARRFVVIGPGDEISIEISLQDDGRTLKVFINDRHR